MRGLPTLPLDFNEIDGPLTEEQNILLGQSFNILALYVEDQLALCGTPKSP